MVSDGRPTLRVGIVGCGRVGAVLGAALQDAGHLVVATSAVSEASQARAENLLPGVPVLSPDEVVARADLILITIPDDHIASVVSGFAALGLFDQPKIVAHAAGALGLDPLQPVIDRGGMAFVLHPAMTFSGESKDLDRLTGTVFAVSGTAESLAVGQSIVMDIGGDPFHLPAESRVLYHAALTHAANHSITLIAQAMSVLRECGLDDPGRVLRPLVEASVDNALQSSDRALTGPVSRGDVGTVTGHLDALESANPQVAQAYRAMAAATAERAITRHLVPQERVDALRRALADPETR